MLAANITLFESPDAVEGAILALTDLCGPPNHDNGNYVCFTHPDMRVTVSRQDQALSTEPKMAGHP